MHYSIVGELSGNTGVYTTGFQIDDFVFQCILNLVNLKSQVVLSNIITYSVGTSNLKNGSHFEKYSMVELKPPSVHSTYIRFPFSLLICNHFSRKVVPEKWFCNLKNGGFIL